ncbi:hypothetical protein Q9314_19320 (plasmid) [Shinella sumterensis]|nr:hypothetical protein Q9314_19320 [Shinella sumterensis]
MPHQHAIEPPKESADYPGRSADCVAALRPAVADLAIAAPEDLTTTMTTGPAGDFAELVAGAERAGWRADEAQDAIRQLAREQEGARGTLFD